MRQIGDIYKRACLRLASLTRPESEAGEASPVGLGEGAKPDAPPFLICGNKKNGGPNGPPFLWGELLVLFASQLRYGEVSTRELNRIER